MSKHSPEFDVVIIGGGASGTALFYTLSRYTNIRKIALVEKYSTVGQVNSNSKNNSQTLHVGDIETNYSIEKVREVKPAAMMVAKYVQNLPTKNQAGIMTQMQKMVLAVGEKEVHQLEKRFTEIQSIFPELEKLTAKEIAKVEPKIMEGRNPQEPVIGLFNGKGYAVDFSVLSQSFIQEAQKNTKKMLEVFMGREVQHITKNKDGYTIETAQGNLKAAVVIVDTDAYSLGFAKSLGYGEEFSLIPVAGTFYFTKEFLRGKVYTVQEPRLPFAAVHGDPDLHVLGQTRWGPTACFFPVLESGKFSTMKSYLTASGLQHFKTWISFASILFEPIRSIFLAKNLLYELPFFGKRLFVKQIQKIVPTVQAKDLHRAKGYGGMRLQRVNINTRELLLGEGKIIGENIIFNMTPSPGASVCLHNALRDAEQIIKFLPHFSFAKERMENELIHETTVDFHQLGTTKPIMIPMPGLL